MKRLFGLLMCPIFFASFPVVSTEVDFELSPTSYSILHQTAYSTAFQSIPTNPNVYEETYAYHDKNLMEPSQTISPNQKIEITDFILNDNQQPVFVLSDGTYLPADPSLVFDDIILGSQVVSQTYYLKEKATFYTTPIRNQAKVVKTTYKSYQPIAVTEIVETPWATLAYVDGKGWIDMVSISETDLRMEAVQKLLDSKYDSDKVAVYVKQLSTNKTAGIKASKQMYSASISKLPLLYYVQEEIVAGTVRLTDTYTYTNKVYEFQGSYKPEGSGSISKEPDNLNYSVSDLINKVAKESDNTASNILAYYVTGSYGKAYQKLTEEIAGSSWDMATRLASPEMAGRMMEALYKQNGQALQSLTATQFDDQRIPRDIPVPVAHKIGDADEFRHDVAVVYADDPFILSIFTENADYELISQIANDVYGILQ